MSAQGFRLRGAAKLRFVSELFDRIAPRYDAANLALSLGQTSIWRWLALGRSVEGRAKSKDVQCIQSSSV